MKMFVWNREDGYVHGILCENKRTAIVSTKHYATKKGAEKANERLLNICGEKYEKQNVPYRSTNPETGEVTVHFRTENLTVAS